MNITEAIIGEFIGEGKTRCVYKHMQDDSLVVKRSKGLSKPKNLQNVIEWQAWIYLDSLDSRQAEWLAPCVDISDNGDILVQKATEPLSYDQKLPSAIPNWLTGDARRCNFGWYQNRLVCHDYALVGTKIILSNLHLVPTIERKDPHTD